jgi:hypothetical protein
MQERLQAVAELDTKARGSALENLKRLAGENTGARLISLVFTNRIPKSVLYN